MPDIQTGASRDKIDLSHLNFSAGRIGRLKGMGWAPVIAGDSIEMDFVGAIRLSPLRRGLAIDSCFDLFTFYIPYRHVYGADWISFMEKGVNSTPLAAIPCHSAFDATGYLGVIPGNGNTIPKFLHQGYLNIYNNYFKAPWMPNRAETPTQLFPLDHRDGFRCCHLKNIWSAPLPPDTKRTQSMTTGATTVDIMALKTAYANLHTEQERTYFMTRYRDVIDSFGGRTSYDADNRPLLLMRSTYWASGYDIDGTDQASLGQFSGRVQTPFHHKVPRFYVPEHGFLMTVALPRFPPTCTEEVHYLIGKGALSYNDISGDPTLMANQPPRQIPMGTLFRGVSSSNNPVQLNVAEGQWLRYQPSYVDPYYHALQGFPFIMSGPIGNTLSEKILINSDSYDPVFQSMQLGHWNIQSKMNVSVFRHIPTARDSIMTS